jgi:hypothetical protein
MFNLIMLLIFILDRVVLVFMFWENSYKFSKWKKTEAFILNSLIRVRVLCVTVLLTSMLLSIE